MKIDIIIPQYNESQFIIQQLLNSIELQQNVDFNEIEVIIVNDGNPETILPQGFLDMYPFHINYICSEHKGVSAARNTGLDAATADYVMFCDADDLFFNACGLYLIFTQLKSGDFDTLVSNFTEETRGPENYPIYVAHEMDSTFVHGKIHNRKFLLDNNIRWNEDLQIHEDSYFNCLCQRLANPDHSIYCPTSFYLWKWRDNSVCRHDPKYILKTFNNMLESSTALVNEFLRRDRKKDAQFYAVSMIYDSYFTMNKKEWIDQENKSYRMVTEKRFKKYYQDFLKLYQEIDDSVKSQIIISIKNRMFQEGLLMESITFDDWIQHIIEL